MADPTINSISVSGGVSYGVGIPLIFGISGFGGYSGSTQSIGPGQYSFLGACQVALGPFSVRGTLAISPDWAISWDVAFGGGAILAFGPGVTAFGGVGVGTGGVGL